MNRTNCIHALRLGALAILASILTGPLFAMGKTEESDFEHVEGTGNWEYTINVADRAPGLYNILVRARDAAGNESLGGPYNVYVDPDSDLPGVSISYPAPEEAVGERLFAVGTARDDDGVEYVEVQVDDGTPVRAEGGEYWSALLPMTNLPDGEHTISARAVDINGTEGEPVRTRFRLDTTKPVSTPTSHDSGVLISRRTKIDGTVEDANGIASLTLVSGDTRQELKLGGRGTRSTFSFQIDPGTMDEGATVWWLESVDQTGSTGITPFLFFVDTSPPELEVLSPAEGERTDAQLRIVGRVFDLVGVASLHYDLSSGESGEIPLTPGDPYWALSVDLPPGTRGAVNATFTVTDVAGNVRSVKRRFEMDATGDLPTLSIESPLEGAVLDRVELAGVVADDDAVASIAYSIDGGEETSLDLDGANGGFGVLLPGLAGGTHEVRAHAVDIYGNTGIEVRRKFTIQTPLPSIAFGQVVRGEASEAYAPGFTLAANERATLTGAVTASGGAALPSRVDYLAGSTAGKATVDGNGAFTVSLPRGTTAGAVAIDLSVTNEAGLVSRTTGFYVQLPAAAEDGTVASVASIVGRGLYLTAPAGGTTPIESATGAITSAPIVVRRGESIRLAAIGGAPSEPTLSPAPDFLTVRTSGNFVIVQAQADGAVSGLRVSAKIGGSTATSAPVDLRTELDSPSIAIPKDFVGRRFATLPELTVAVKDSSAIAGVSIAVRAASMPGGDETALQPSPASVNASAGEDGYTATPPTPSDEGPAVVVITATDASGIASTLALPVVIDRTAPTLEVITPVADEPVNGTVTLYALLSEPGSTTSVSVADPATDLAVGRLVTYSVVTSLVDGALHLGTVDSAGNSGETIVAIKTNESADIPTLELQVPTEGGLVQQEFRLSGVLLDDDAPASVTYRVNDGDEVTVATDGTFDINVPMNGLEDGDHSVTIYGTDIGGAKSGTITRNFAISRSQPVSVLVSPSIDTYQHRIVSITGTSSDPNGVDAVYVSTDNGASYQVATGTTEWSYRLDTTLLEDGTHSILVRAVDGAGEESLLATTINVDNTPPVLELTEPSDGVSVSGRFIIDGRGEDNALRGVRLVAQPLGDESSGGSAPIELASFTEPGPFAYAVETASLRPGWYNIRVEAEDLAGNTRRIARNLLVQPAAVTAAPEILVPADGDTRSHQFIVTARSNPDAGSLTLLAGDAPVGVIKVGANGIGSLAIEPGTVPDGTVTLSLRTEAQSDGQALTSAPHTITYQELGPWIEVDDPVFMSFVRDRPFISGTAGYELALAAGDDAQTQRANREVVAKHAVTLVEVSLDNGRTYSPAHGTDAWQYRLETGGLPDGEAHLLVRAHFADGESAVTRYSVVVDERPPEVRLLEPQERDTFDEKIRIVGVTTDENPLADVAVVLREGDKSNYELPSFIQGLYVDAHFLGATYSEIGAGLTFFDNNVRLQAQLGLAPPGRFSGLVLGAKLLANVASFPASFFFGPDLDWLSAALAIGANFSYYTMSEDQIAFTPNGLVLAGMVAQLEFPIVTVPDIPMFNTYSFYTEGQLWFISSDVDAGTAFRLSFGVRADVF